MKKLLVGLICIMIMLFLYMYQFPIISSEEAIKYAENVLNNPPEEWQTSIVYKGTSLENITTYLTEKSGFWNELTNQTQWEVTIKYNGGESTVVIDAYNGDFVDLYGSFN
ncbi:PepSY domain-containing protein [Lysinibacillus sp. LZ02]|uniref:PepSY domain-containing protein n=1 Tax=Lysinibacillus sp. LZ02 TaxID=3420668 RepID=UPI003D359DBD